MLKKTMTFKDLDNNDVTEDFYFNLSLAEIAELEISQKDGLSGYLERIVASNDGQQIIDTFKNIIAKSVGKRSEDGRRFMKSDEISREFMETDAYSQMFMELVTNAESAAEFIRSIVPANLAEATQGGARVTNLPLPPADEEPAWVKENRDPTTAEIRAMTPEELQALYIQKTSAQSE